MLYRKLAGKLKKIVQQRSSWIWNIHTHTHKLCIVLTEINIWELTFTEPDRVRERGMRERGRENRVQSFRIGDTCSLSSEYCNTLRSVFFFLFSVKMGKQWKRDQFDLMRILTAQTRYNWEYWKTQGIMKGGLFTQFEMRINMSLNFRVDRFLGKRLKSSLAHLILFIKSSMNIINGANIWWCPVER